jgi:uncharacterized protein YjbJ (UPF0337 family)
VSPYGQAFAPPSVACDWRLAVELSVTVRIPCVHILENGIMDKDRIIGSTKELKGAVKQAVGKAVGDAKLETDGKADKMEGKVQNAVGGLKDTLRGK